MARILADCLRHKFLILWTARIWRTTGAKFFLAEESPEHGTQGPASAGFTTVRIEVFVDDPIAVQEQALAAGATNHTPVTEDNYEMQGGKPIRRIAQGAVVDPFGHIWLIGKILECNASSG